MKFILLVMVMVFSGTFLSAQRSWEGVTLEYLPTIKGDSVKLSFEDKKFWMKLDHGVARISNAYEEDITTADRIYFWFLGSYHVDSDTLIVDLIDRKYYLKNKGTVNLTRKEIDRNKVPPTGEIAEQYKFLIIDESDGELELLALHSFFYIKNKDSQWGKDSRKNVRTKFLVTDNVYPWLTQEKFLIYLPRYCGTGRNISSN